MNELKEYCLVYSIFSTHITFFLDFDGIKTTTPIAAMASNTWTNEITGWAYTDNEFLIYIENLVNRSMSVATTLTGFRELEWLPMIKRIEESIPSLYDRLDKIYSDVLSTVPKKKNKKGKKKEGKDLKSSSKNVNPKSEYCRL